MAFPGPREENFYLAKAAETAERYDEMASFMDGVVIFVPDNEDLTADERNLLYTAYKNVVTALRSSWHKVLQMEQKETVPERIPAISGYRENLKSRLTKTCRRILEVAEIRFAPLADSVESKVSYAKIKGDFNRYIAEVTTGIEKEEATARARQAYQSATVNPPMDEGTLDH